MNERVWQYWLKFHDLVDAMRLNQSQGKLYLISFVLVSGLAVAVIKIFGTEIPLLNVKQAEDLSLKRKLSKLILVSSNIKEYQTKLLEYRTRLKAMLASRFDEKTSSQIVGIISQAVQKHHLALLKLEWMKNTTKPIADVFRLRLSLTGGYHELGQFFTTMANHDPLFHLESLEISVGSDSILEMNCELHFHTVDTEGVVGDEV